MRPHGDAYEGELASSILLDQNTAPGRADLPGLPRPLFDSTLSPPNFFLDESRGRPAQQRMDIARTPSPSPVYQYGNAIKGFGSESDGMPMPTMPATSSSTSSSHVGLGRPSGHSGAQHGGAGFAGYGSSQTMWHGGQSGFVNMVLRNESGSPGLSAVKPDPKAPMSPAGPTPNMPMDAGMLSMMMALQNQPPSTGSTGPNNFPSMPPPRFVRAPEPEFTTAATRELSPSQALPPGPQPPRSQNENKKGKPRKEKEPPKALQPQQHEPGAIAPGSASFNTRAVEKGGGKGDRRRRGAGHAEGDESRMTGKPRPQTSSPLIEHLKARERVVDLAELSLHISEIAQDQYGSRLIQQKLEVATEEQKQQAFKQVLQKMNQLTTDVFGNYVIQKFFEYGNAEQRRILAEQLVGQVLKLSLQMYGCRVVQKALDSVPIEKQVLLIGELKGHVLKCIEDQHGNHVIQKCIERLPTDRIGFIVDSFLGQAARMAKHCYGCRVIQRLIEYCASVQISALLDEVLQCCMELATDQYGNYVVQHVMEHSSRPGDRQHVMNIIRKNILSLSCHKYASNVIEKALQCATPDERALLVEAICGQQNDPHPPLLVMMRDRFGNYIVQRVIALAQLPQRDMLFWKLREHMPVLKKSNTYGKHIISAMERAQAGVKD